MFSGGRDSTVAAVRLSRAFAQLVLVTVTSSHLVGIERVRRRLAELRGILPPRTTWLHMGTLLRGSENLTGVSLATCLPCQLDYCVIGARVSLETDADALALGYAGYQSSWPEQTPYATSALQRELAGLGVHVLFPSYSLHSKHEAENELVRAGLSGESLEQKCLRQSTNVDLNPAALRRSVDEWVSAIRTEVQRGGSTPPVFTREDLS